MKNVFLLTSCILLSMTAFSQSYQLTGLPVAYENDPMLRKAFSRYQVFHIDDDALFNYVADGQSTFYLQMSLRNFTQVNAELSRTQIVTADYFTTLQTENGPNVIKEMPDVHTFSGTVGGRLEDRMALTVAANFIHGFFETDGRTYYLEPLRLFNPGAMNDLYVIYDQNDVVSSEDVSCSAVEVRKEIQMLNDHNDDAELNPPCVPLELQIAIASDFRMVQRHGSYGNVIAHNLGVINDAQVNWDTEFSRNIFLRVSTQWVSNSPLTEPWGNNTSSATLLGIFRQWAEAGGFGLSAVYDLGHWRTARTMYNAQGLVAAGSSYSTSNGEPVTCTEYRYSVFSETNGEGTPLTPCQLRTTVSHEMGHSFGAPHTSIGIMIPTLTCTNVWATSSTNQINYGISQSPCLQEFYCVLPNTIDQPDALKYLCSGIQSCYTFSNYDCVTSFVVTSLNPSLQITTNGKTICMLSQTPGFHSVTVSVTAVGSCGNEGGTTLWDVLINSPEGCLSIQNPGEDRASGQEDTGEGLFVSATNDFITVQSANPLLQNKDIQIFDLSGRVVLHTEHSGGTVSIPLQELPQGVLVVRAAAGGETVVSKVVHF